MSLRNGGSYSPNDTALNSLTPSIFEFSTLTSVTVLDFENK
jgi:hypothetical protein